MRRLTKRLVIWGVVLGVSWIAYQLSDVTDCNGPKAEQWAEASFVRMDEANLALEGINESTTTAQFSTLASEAETRYIEQESQEGPSCLSDLQGITSEAFYYEWKTYDAAAAEDYEFAVTNLEKAESAHEAMESEYYRLEAEYGWDI